MLSQNYRVKLNLPKKVLRISSTKLSFLKETHLTKLCCSDLFTHQE